MTILDAMTDPALFGRWFQGASWDAWRTFLCALFGLPFPTTTDVEIFGRHTGRTAAPPSPAREGWVIVGRRGGKSRIAALVAVYLAAFRTYSGVLAPGEVGTLAIIAADRRQARVVMRYIVAFLEGVPMLKALIVSRTKETIELGNRVVIEVHSASFRAVRGYTLIGVIADEIAFWGTDDAGANPDVEILTGLRPGMATTGGLLLCISSPYARRGALWDAYRRHFGQDGPVLVWQAPTAAMNPAVDQQVIAEAYADDDASASAEYGALFRSDVEAFVSREVIEACTIPGRGDLPPSGELEYCAFTDPAGGSGQDSFTLAIAHTMTRDDRPVVVIDALRERKPPFSPADVTKEFAALLRTYRVDTVVGDRFAGEWPREKFREGGISYSVGTMVKSDLYRDALPLLTSLGIELPDHPVLHRQLLGLERKTARSGRDSIDHAPRGHDDVVNVVAGAASLVRGDAARAIEEVELSGI
jgi:hypothetical protein